MKYLIILAMLVTQVQAAQNRLSILAGEGAQKGFTGNTNPISGKITNGFNRGFVGGVQFQRLVEEDGAISVGLQAQTNDTFSVILGVDF